MQNPKFTEAIVTLGNTYTRLKDTLAASNTACTKASTEGDLAGITDASEILREVADEFKRVLEAAHTTLPDGRNIFIPDLVALQNFAIDNGKESGSFYEKVTIKGGRVVKLDASKAGISTVRALSTLTKLWTLHLEHNPNLTTLCGVPSESLEQILAFVCDLKDGLLALKDTRKLRIAFLSNNPNLVSLAGISTEHLQWLYALNCGLSGDLSALKSAIMLQGVNVSTNPNLATLSGVSTESLEQILASGCSLKSDNSISILSSANKLKVAFLEGNLFNLPHSDFINQLREKIKHFRI